MLASGDTVRIGTVYRRLGRARDEESTAPSPGEEIGKPPRTDSGRPPISEELVEIRRLVHELRDWHQSLPPAANAPVETVEELTRRIGRVANSVADLERNRILAQTLAEVGKLIHLIADLDTILKVTLDLAVRAL